MGFRIFIHMLLFSCKTERVGFTLIEMKPCELFGVLVRFAGLVIVLYGLYEIWGGFDNVCENLISKVQGDSSDQPSSFTYFMFGIPALVLGVVVFFCANLIGRLAYRNLGVEH